MPRNQRLTDAQQVDQISNGDLSLVNQVIYDGQASNAGQRLQGDFELAPLIHCNSPFAVYINTCLYKSLFIYYVMEVRNASDGQRDEKRVLCGGGIGTKC